jgi:hypothetical protein
MAGTSDQSIDNVPAVATVFGGIKPAPKGTRCASASRL